MSAITNRRLAAASPKTFRHYASYTTGKQSNGNVKDYVENYLRAVENFIFLR